MRVPFQQNLLTFMRTEHYSVTNLMTVGMAAKHYGSRFLNKLKYHVAFNKISLQHSNSYCKIRNIRVLFEGLLSEPEPIDLLPPSI